MTVLRLTSLALVKLGYLLETLSIPHYSFIASKDELGSENVLGAGNQQERSVGVLLTEILRDYTPGIRYLSGSR